MENTVVQQKSIEDLTGYIGNLTPQQAQVLEKVKDHVLNKLNVRNPRFDDQYFLRFCRARQFEYEKVIQMFEDLLYWRTEKNVDEIYKLDFPRIKEIEFFYPHGYYGVDKKGRPVYIERYANLDIKKMFAIMNEKEFINYYIQSYERLVHVIFKEASRARGKLIERTVTILDMKGFGVTSALSGDNRHFMQLAIKIAQDYYPEMMAKMFIINTGFTFKALWAIVKPFLDKKTKEKISILGSDFKKELNEWIDDDQLPDFLGGTCTKKLGEPFGPWSEKLQKSMNEKTLFLEEEAKLE